MLKSIDEIRYFTAYHPFLPFLDSQVSMDHYFELSPLLGWSIVIIAARHFPSQPNLFHSLLSDYSSLLWKTISEMPQTPPAPPVRLTFPLSSHSCKIQGLKRYTENGISPSDLQIETFVAWLLTRTRAEKQAVPRCQSSLLGMRLATTK